MKNYAYLAEIIKYNILYANTPVYMPVALSPLSL